MPAFHVRVNTNVTKEFVINAVSREAVEGLVRAGVDAIEAEITNSQSVVHVRTDTDYATSVYDADPQTWVDLVQKAAGD